MSFRGIKLATAASLLFIVAVVGCPTGLVTEPLVDGCRDDTFQACASSQCGCLNNACIPKAGSSCTAQVNGSTVLAKIDGCDDGHRTTCFGYGCGCVNNMCSGGACARPPVNNSLLSGLYIKYDGCNDPQREACAGLTPKAACLNGMCRSPTQPLYDGCSDASRRSFALFGCGCWNDEPAGCPNGVGITTDNCSPQKRAECALAHCGCKASACYRGPGCDANGTPIARAPQILLAPPTGGTTITIPQYVFLKTTPADNLSSPDPGADSGIAQDRVTKVEFYLDDVLAATETTPPFQLRWFVDGRLHGTHTWKIKAYNGSVVSALSAANDPVNKPLVFTVNIPTPHNLPTDAGVHHVPDPGPNEIGSLTDAGSNPEASVDYLPNAGTQMQRVDIYRASGSGAKPVLMVLHGGGFGSGCETADCPDPLSRRNYVRADGGVVQNIPRTVFRYLSLGWSIVSVEYRGLPAFKYPVPLHDVKTAIRWVKLNASAYEFNPAKIVLSGISAGGNLALLAGISAAQGALEPTDLPSTYNAVNSTVAGIIDWQGPDIGTLKGHDFLITHDVLTPYLNCAIKPAAATPQHPACTEAAINAVSAKTYVNGAAPKIYLAFSPGDDAIPPLSGQVIAQQYINAGKGQDVWFDLTDGLADAAAPVPAEGGLIDVRSGTPAHSVEWVGINLTKLDEFMAGIKNGQ